MTYMLNHYDKEAGFPLTDNVLSHLFPMHRCSCTMATEGMAFRMRNTLTYEPRSEGKDSPIR